ncbi:MAG: hypothetical protein AAGB29_06150 [Planctomycetota bacterium]
MSKASAYRGEAVGVAAGLLVALAVLPWVVTFSPEVVWDIDPRSAVDAAGRALPVTSVGPVGGAWWSAGLVGWSAVVMAGALWCGVGVRWWMVALWGLGVVWAMPWLGQRIGEGWLVGSWIGGASAGLALAHAARLAAVRRWSAAVLLGVAVPIVADAGWYVASEHPMTVAQYEAEREETLAARGWAPGSPQAELYERRLRSPDVIGAIGFSNVMGTVAGALLVLALGWAAAGRGGDEKMHRGGVVLMVLLAVGLAWLVWATRSKGALAATAAGVGWLGLAWAVSRWRGRGALLPAGRWVLAFGALLPAVGAVAAVAVRGALGPPADWTGERSLLFRWHYWVGAWRTWAEQGWGGRWWGVGPSGFTEGYLRNKPAINPEEVTSVHAVWVDWPVMLGVGGAAWLALLLGMVAVGAWRCVGRGEAALGEQREVVQGVGLRGRVALAAGLVALVMGSQFVYEAPMMWLDARLLWLVAAIGFIAVVAVVSGRVADDGLVGVASWAWVGAAVVTVSQSQIEMGFFQPGGVAGLWCVVGVASAVGSRPAEPMPSVGRLVGVAGVACVGVFVAGLLVAWLAVPTGVTLARMHESAELWRRGDVGNLRLSSGLTAAATEAPVSERAWSWATRIATASDNAAWLETLLAEGATRHRPTSVQRSRAALAQLRDDPTGELAAWRAAIDAAPHQLTYRVQLAQSLDRAGDSQEATQAYLDALALSDQLYLDPAKQLTAEQLDAIRRRIEQLTR